MREKMQAGKSAEEALASTREAMYFHDPHAGGSRARPFNAELMEYTLQNTLRRSR